MFSLLLVIAAVRKYILKQDLQREKFTPVVNFGSFAFALLAVMTWVSTLFQSSAMGVQLLLILAYVDGSKVFAGITNQISFELVWIITVIVAGICASIGDVRQIVPTCVCVSGFLLMSTMAVTIDTFFVSSNPLLGSVDKIYQPLKEHSSNPANNGPNRLTFRTASPMQSALAKFIISLAQVVLDQANWEICSVSPAGKASAGVLTACFLWLALPFAFGTSTSLGYFALRKDLFNNVTIEVDSADAAITVFASAFGNNGTFLLFAMNAFIIVTVGIFQLFSISAVFTYDIYATHLKPFRVCYDSNCCILCGKTRGEVARPKDKCECVPVIFCEMCQRDNEVQLSNNGPVKPVSICRVHADYKNYINRLETLHGTAILVILGFILPLGILLNYPGVNPEAVNSIASVTVTAAVGSVIFALFFTWLTSQAIVISCILGGTLAAVAWFILNTLVSLGKIPHLTLTEVHLFSSVIGVCSGFILPIIISFATKRTDEDFGKKSWERLFELDNPLTPWGERFSRQFSLPSYDPHSYASPPYEEVEAALRTSQLTSFIGGAIFVVLVLALWPGLSAIPTQFSREGFKVWVFDELIRQLTIHCAERGLLLLRVRNEVATTIAALQSIYASGVVFGLQKSLAREADRNRQENRVVELENEIAQLKKRVKVEALNSRALEEKEANRLAAATRRAEEDVNFLRKGHEQLKAQLEDILNQFKISSL
ncbi:hypothetical protein SprV_0301229100 [Sparganum proliferum]